MKYNVLVVLLIIMLLGWVYSKRSIDKFIKRKLSKIYIAMKKSCKSDREFAAMEKEIEREFFSYNNTRLSKLDRIRLFEQIVDKYVKIYNEV